MQVKITTDKREFFIPYEKLSKTYKEIYKTLKEYLNFSNKQKPRMELQFKQVDAAGFTIYVILKHRNIENTFRFIPPNKLNFIVAWKFSKRNKRLKYKLSYTPIKP